MLLCEHFTPPRLDAYLATCCLQFPQHTAVRLGFCYHAFPRFGFALRLRAACNARFTTFTLPPLCHPAWLLPRAPRTTPRFWFQFTALCLWFYPLLCARFARLPFAQALRHTCPSPYSSFAVAPRVEHAAAVWFLFGSSWFCCFPLRWFLPFAACALHRGYTPLGFGCGYTRAVAARLRTVTVDTHTTRFGLHTRFTLLRRTPLLVTVLTFLTYFAPPAF